jgi:hypothetical protein
MRRSALSGEINAAFSRKGASFWAEIAAPLAAAFPALAACMTDTRPAGAAIHALPRRRRAGWAVAGSSVAKSAIRGRLPTNSAARMPQFRA